MKDTPCLDLYYECMNSGIVRGFNGLCYSGLRQKIGSDIFDLIEPTKEDCYEYEISRIGYWGEEEDDSDGRVFNRTRQNLVLLLACINSEL